MSNLGEYGDTQQPKKVFVEPDAWMHGFLKQGRCHS
jgi:hypothetical protein